MENITNIEELSQTLSSMEIFMCENGLGGRDIVGCTCDNSYIWRDTLVDPNSEVMGWGSEVPGSHGAYAPRNPETGRIIMQFWRTTYCRNCTASDNTEITREEYDHLVYYMARLNSIRRSITQSQ